MKRTQLKRKTPLKAKTQLKAKTPLKNHAGSTTCRKRSSLQKKQYKPVCPYESIFTNDMTRCYITGDTYNVHPHHIFGAANKHNSEIYHFMLPLRFDWHEGTKYSIHEDRVFELKIKLQCQNHWITVLGKTKEEFIEVFGKWWVMEDVA